MASQLKYQLLKCLVMFTLLFSFKVSAALIWDNGDGDYLWNTTSVNWSGSTWGNGTPTDAVFNGTGVTVTLDENITVRDMTFDTSGYLIDGNGNELELLASSIRTTALANAEIGAVLTGVAGLFKVGGGVLTLSGKNTFTGGVTLSAGTLKLGHNQGLGDRFEVTALTIANGATLDLGGNRRLKGYQTGSIIVSGAGVNGLGAIVNGGANAGGAFDDEIQLAGDTTIGITSNRTDIDGAISIASGVSNVTLTKVGGGNLRLGGDNTSATELKTIRIEEGDVTFSNADSLGIATIDLEGGFMRFDHTMTVGNDINFNNANGGIKGLSNNKTLTLTGILTLNADNAELTPNNATRTIVIAGTLQGNATQVDLKKGVTRIDSAATVTYAGAFNLNQSDSTLELGDGVTLSNAITIRNLGGLKTIRLEDGATSGGISGDISLRENGNGNFDVLVGAGGTLTLSGVLSEDANGPGVDKVGAGTLVLTNTNTYKTRTNVEEGTLALAGNGSIFDTEEINLGTDTFLDVSGLNTDFSLGNGQRLTGVGTVVGGSNAIQLATGIVAPGNGVGTLSVAASAVVFTDTSQFNVEIHGDTGVSDLLAITGDLTLDGVLNVTQLDGTLELGEYWTLITYTGSLTDNGMVLGTTPSNPLYRYELDTNLIQGAVVVKISAVPEPSSAVFLGLGGLVLLFRRRMVFFDHFHHSLIILS